MKFIEFQKKYKDSPIILSQEAAASSPGSCQAMRNQIRRWVSRGLLVKLRRGAYVFARSMGGKTDVPWIANQLYEPSYLSLEYALNFYGIIPERVADITSITTLKTARFDNALGRFVYRHVQPDAFRGFVSVKIGRTACFMAEPEKAAVDFIYFHLPLFKNNTRDILEESMRFQNYEDLSAHKLTRWAAVFNNPKLTRVVLDFCAMTGE